VLGGARRRYWPLAVFAFWGMMTGALFYKEILPNYLAPAHPSYQDLFSDESLPSRRRMGIYVGDERAGFSDTTSIRLPEGSYRITNRTEVASERLGLLNPLSANFTLNLNPEKRLEDFTLDLKEPFQAEVTGKVLQDTIRISAQIGRFSIEQEYPFRAEDLLVTSLNPATFPHRLRVGKRWTAKMLNPRNFTVDVAEFQVVKKEKIEIGGRSLEAYQVLMRIPGFQKDLKAWVSTDGEVLRQETPFGFVLEKEAIDD